jgi:hypothetical protein
MLAGECMKGRATEVAEAHCLVMPTLSATVYGAWLHGMGYGAGHQPTVRVRGGWSMIAG